MAFCSKCGTQLKDDAKFCPACGASASGATAGSANTNGGAAGNGAAAGSATNSTGSKSSNDIFNTPDTTADYAADDIEKNKVMAVLSYIGILFLLPLFGAKESKFAQFHANQGVILLLCEIAYNIITSIISLPFILLPFAGAFIAVILRIVNILFLVLMVFGIVNAAQGKAKELPLIGKFRIIKY